MLKPLPLQAFPSVRTLFAAHDNHLATQAVLAGDAGWGEVWVDDPARPRFGLLRSGRRYYLAGDPTLPGLAADLARLFAGEVFPAAQTSGEEVCLLFYDRAEWEPVLEGQVLANRRAVHAPRRYFEFQGFPQDWRALLRPGDQMCRIDPALLVDLPMDDPAHLREELASECPSVDFFLEHRFGFGLLREGRLAGWCLSEYNCGDRCEIGIETLETYQRQGVATITTGGLVEHALAQGIHRIGWDCWTRNEPSVAAALRAGFMPVEEYEVFLVWIE